MSEEKRKSPDEMIFKVVMQSNDGDSIRVNLPLAMISALSKSGMLNVGFSTGDGEMTKNLNSIDFGYLLSLAEAGAVGKLVEMRGGDGDIIDVYVE